MIWVLYTKKTTGTIPAFNNFTFKWTRAFRQILSVPYQIFIPLCPLLLEFKILFELSICLFLGNVSQWCQKWESCFLLFHSLKFVALRCKESPLGELPGKLLLFWQKETDTASSPSLHPALAWAFKYYWAIAAILWPWYDTHQEGNPTHRR